METSKIKRPRPDFWTDAPQKKKEKAKLKTNPAPLQAYATV
jgi:hypothetical protein